MIDHKTIVINKTQSEEFRRIVKSKSEKVKAIRQSPIQNLKLLQQVG